MRESGILMHITSLPGPYGIGTMGAGAYRFLDFLKQVGGETDNLSFGAQGLPIGVEAEASFLEALERSRDDVMLVAKADGRIIANGSVNRLPRRMSHRAEISIAVARGYWNLGIGGRMMLEVMRNG